MLDRVTIKPCIEEKRVIYFMEANCVPDNGKNPYDRSCFVIPRANGTVLAADLSPRLGDVSN
jgi:hypothetical protein